MDLHNDGDCIIKEVDKDTINISLKHPDGGWLTKGFNKSFLLKILQQNTSSPKP